MTTDNQDRGETTLWQRYVQALEEAFTFRWTENRDETRLALTLEDASIVVLAQLFVRLVLASAPWLASGQSIFGTPGILILIVLLGDLLVYGGCAAAAFTVGRKDRLALLLFGAGLMMLILSVVEVVVSAFIPMTSSLLGIMVFFLFVLLRNALRTGILPAIATALGIVVGAGLISGTLMVSVPGVSDIVMG